MSERPPLIEYAPPAPRPWRRRVRRALLAGASVVVIATVLASLAWAASGMYWRARVRAKLERLGAYSRPADLVVYDDDRRRMDVLLAQPYYDYFPGSYGFPGNYADEAPRPYAYYDDLGPRGANTGVNRRGHAVLFLHRLVDANGKAAVVEVFLDPWGTLTLGLWDDDADPNMRVWELGSGFPIPLGEREQMGLDDYTDHADVVPFKMDDPRPLRIFAGQPDPLDPSRFTIRYDLGGTPGVIDGQLATDGTVRLSARGGN
jgi:hypothetical protein